ncbi:MAG: hypothetical protein JW880_07815 [Candidatus Thermoplasmatota archaeon]|nr:hypothetical protein [Candidatus Thermoplasmatota archaeon]
MLSENRSALVITESEQGVCQVCCQLAATRLEAGQKVVFVETKTPPDEVVFYLSKFGVNTSAFESEGSFAIVDACAESAPVPDPHVIKVGDPSMLSNIFECVTKAVGVLGGRPVQTVFDSLTPLLATHEPIYVSRFYKDLSTISRFTGSLTASVTSGVVTEDILASFSSIADSVFETRIDDNFRRQVRLRHVSGSLVKPTWIPFEWGIQNPVDSGLLWRRGFSAELDLSD